MKLRPCPFCGGSNVRVVAAEIRPVHYDGYAQCDDCGAAGPPDCASPRSIAAAWNRRPGAGLVPLALLAVAACVSLVWALA